MVSPSDPCCPGGARRWRAAAQGPRSLQPCGGGACAGLSPPPCGRVTVQPSGSHGASRWRPPPATAGWARTAPSWRQPARGARARCGAAGGWPPPLAACQASGKMGAVLSTPPGPPLPCCGRRTAPQRPRAASCSRPSAGTGSPKRARVPGAPPRPRPAQAPTPRPGRPAPCVRSPPGRRWEPQPSEPANGARARGAAAKRAQRPRGPALAWHAGPGSSNDRG